MGGGESRGSNGIISIWSKRATQSTETSLLFTRILASVFGVYRFVRSFRHANQPQSIPFEENWNNTVLFFLFFFSQHPGGDRSRFIPLYSVDCPRKNSPTTVFIQFSFCFVIRLPRFTTSFFSFFVQALLFGSSRSRQRVIAQLIKRSSEIYIYVCIYIRGHSLHEIAPRNCLSSYDSR